MRFELISLLLLLLMTAACDPKSEQKNELKSEQKTEQPAEIKDTIAVALSSRHVSDLIATSALNIAYPIANKKNKRLVASINEWICERLGGTYAEDGNGDYDKLLADTAAIAEHYFAAICKENADNYKELFGDSDQEDRFIPQLYDSISISKLDEGANWVTMNYTNDIYLGGAHGSYIIYGQTFRKSDGRRIGWEILKPVEESNLQDLMRKGILSYFNSGEEQFKEEDLENLLQGEASAYYIPLPQCPPLFTKEGIFFLYNQYEIAAYAAGLPQFVIPYEDLMPLLNTTAKRMIGK
ncbi:MAG: RsiV family protein [Prevotella sp.]|nr:RsiV family protein [Prevotella sp.]